MLLLLLVLAAIASPSRTRPEVFLTRKEALAEAFPGQRVESESFFLTDEQARRVEQRARAKLPSRIVTRYVAYQGDQISGYGYFDTHIVRTMPETILVVLEPDGTHRQTMILSFHEPSDYRPRPRWLETLRGRAFDEIWPGRGVPRITGATLTTRAITDAVRRILVLHQILAEEEAP